MGDRGNIFVKDNGHMNTGVYLYTHWNGNGILHVVRNSLAKRWRWDDSAYLTRIIFDEMTNDSHGERDGYGISATLQDNNHPIVVVDTKRQLVQIKSEDARKFLDSFGFEYFAGLTDEEIDEIIKRLKF